MQRSILHIDMDAFFAAVEQLDNPNYRGKPVIVGADPKGGYGRGVVATASYEARTFGVHSALPISQAYKRCPHGIYVRGRYKRYAEVSSQVMSILADFTPVIQKISIDEAFLDITASLNALGGAENIGRRIKERIKQELHLTASVGLAPNKFVAKIASDLDKPDGFVRVLPGDEKKFLAELPISKLWGVGKKTEAVLHRMGLATIGQIAASSEVELTKRLGKWGGALWRLSNGIDERTVQTGHVQKSISQETTFEEDVADEVVIEETIMRLAESLARLMRKSKLKGKTITLKLRLEDFSTFTRSRTMSDFIDSPQILRAMAFTLYREFRRRQKKVRLIGIGVSQLNSISGEQLGLFEQEEPLDTKMTRLMDSLQDKYGSDLIKRAALLSKNEGP